MKQHLQMLLTEKRADDKAAKAMYAPPVTSVIILTLLRGSAKISRGNLMVRDKANVPLNRKHQIMHKVVINVIIDFDGILSVPNDAMPVRASTTKLFPPPPPQKCLCKPSDS